MKGRSSVRRETLAALRVHEELPQLQEHSDTEHSEQVIGGAEVQCPRAPRSASLPDLQEDTLMCSVEQEIVHIAI